MILWIASYPKSGSTWVRLLLANWFSEEPIGVNDMWKVGMDLQDTDPQLWGEAGDEDRQLKARPHVLKRITLARPGITFCKTHSARASYKGIQMIPDDLTAGAIHVVRDPRDVVVSAARHWNVDIDEAIWRMGHRHLTLVAPHGPLQFCSDWSSHFFSWGGDATILVRYEDLLADPVHEMLRILSFLGERVTDMERIARITEFCDFGNLQAQEEREGFSEAVNGRFFNNGKSVWREVLSGKQEKRILRRHRAAMEKTGYLERSTSLCRS